MVIQPSPSGKEYTPSFPVQVSALAGYQRFGEYLRVKRKQLGLLQREIAECFSLTESTYGFLERERRAPQIDELVPMFAALVQLQNDKRLPPMQVIEAETFFRLGKAIIEKKEKKRPNVTQQEWNEIEQQLISLVDYRQRLQLHLISGKNSTAPLDLESPDSRRRKALGEVLKTDLAHMLERDEWVKHLLAYPDRTPQIKVSVIQAGMGAGKSHALALLTQRLAERDDLYLIPYQFKHSETMTAEDHLDEFLATLHADLTMQVTDETKQRPLAERIDQVLATIRAYNHKVIILLDDAQEMFPPTSEWSASWHQFFATFINQPHGATLYMMTRTWPGWDERKRSFLEEEDLPDLSIETGIQLWKRQGFDDVDDVLLRKVCERCGQNPQGIEMLAFQYKRRGFSINWRGASQETSENPHEASLKKLLESETLFSGNLDETSRSTLQQVFSNRLSGEDLKLLECLALAPLGIPFDIVVNRFDYAAQSYEKLVKASFADLKMAAAGRAAVVTLVREAMLQSFTRSHKQEIEQLVTDIYTYWFSDHQEFRDDAEKAGLLAEMLVRYIRQRQLLKAAELFISYGWLCALFGHVTRIQRAFEEMIKEDRGKKEDVLHEVGRLLLFYHFPTLIRGEKVNPRERDIDFHRIHDFVLAGEVMLQPHPEIYVANILISRIIYEKHYQEAYHFLQETMDRIVKTNVIDPEVQASFLHNKANLLGRWSSHAIEAKQSNEARRLQIECVEVLAEVVKIWRICLKNCLPIQEQYYHFKLARALNDLAYYSRMLGHLDDAEKAIIECLYLKEEKKATLPKSLAVSLGEYAQILKAQGQYLGAEEKNDQAIKYNDQILRSGDTSASADKGMLLFERASIYEMQGRWDEAKPLLQDALPLLDEDRDAFRFEAEQLLARIQMLEESTSHYQLDSRWYARYHPLASYDDMRWLSQAGPFTVEEQHIWNQLYPRHHDQKIWRQLAEIIRQSKEREFEQSVIESRLPHILYPAIDIDDIRSRIQGFSELKEMIEQEEANVIVGRLYAKKIDEHLHILRLVEATYKQNITDLHIYNEALYGKITRAEMIIALREFFKMLMRAQSHPQARELVEQILQQLKKWHLFAEDFLTPEDKTAKKVISEKLRLWRKTPVSSHAVQLLYEEVLKTYSFTEWQVILSPERDGISLDLDLCHLYLPTNDHFTVLSVAEFLTEEIETHILRSVSGKRSKLALLSSGTQGFLPTEEGLAAHAIDEMYIAQGLGQKSNTWTTTLSTGMAAGVFTPPQSFGSLYNLFAKAFLANHIQSGRYETLQMAEEAARYDALVRISRTFRGISNLEVTEVCNLKDRVYLQGYREVAEALTNFPSEHLYVGSISIHDLKDMENLHILQPAVEIRYLSHDPQLFNRIVTLEKQ